MKQILKAISRIDMPKLIFWPNADAGSEEISTAIREYREKKIIKNAWYVKNLDHELFFQVLKLTKCLVGNTSAAIREGSFIGVPSVSIGSRQNGRDRGRNVLDSSYDTNEIYKKIKKQLSIKGVLKDNIYGRGNASKKIKKILENINVDIQKQLTFE